MTLPKPAFKLLSAELESFGDINNTYTTVEEVNEVLTNYVQKSEFEEQKTKITETSDLLDTYSGNHQDLAVLVGEQVVKIMELNTEISKLKTENATLKETISAFEQRLSALEKANDPDAEWKEYYIDFTEKANDELASYFAFDYYAENKSLNLWNTNIDGEEAPAGEYLLILHDKDMKKHFIRMISQADCTYTAYYDEIYLHENAPNTESIFEGIDVNIDSVDNKSFDEVYKKPA